VRARGWREVAERSDAKEFRMFCEKGQMHRLRDRT
jgi:hypothetical protein